MTTFVEIPPGPHYGLWTGKELHAQYSRKIIRANLDLRVIQRIARTIYVHRDAMPEVARPILSGARLTCVSALLFYGAWNPWPRTRLPQHISPVPATRHLHQLTKSRVVVHAVHPESAFDHFVAPLELAIVEAARCLEPVDTFIILESLVTRNIASLSEVNAALDHVGQRRRSDIGTLTGVAGSGSESRVIHWLHVRGVRFVAQAMIPGVGRVDALVGDRLIIEIDSGEFHSAPANVEADRRREAAARALGYETVRYSWQQVTFEWDTVEAELAALIRSRRHLFRKAA